MGLRPARCYKDVNGPAYTRVAVGVQNKNYIGGYPGTKIRQFNMGNQSKEYSYLIKISSKEAVQIRDNAIESVRIMINRLLQSKIGKDEYFLKVLIYPHQILRTNIIAQGTHADRLSSGMKRAFGKATGRAARVKPGTDLFAIHVNSKIDEISKTLKKVTAKLPCKVKVEVEKIGE